MIKKTEAIISVINADINRLFLGVKEKIVNI